MPPLEPGCRCPLSERWLSGRSRRPLTRRGWMWLLVLLGGTLCLQRGWAQSPSAVGGNESSVQSPESSDPASKVTGHSTPDSGHDHEGGGHVDPAAAVLLGIVIILLFAKVGGDLFERVGLPAVLGELMVGIVLGNTAFLTGGVTEVFTGVAHEWHAFDFLHAPPEDAAVGDPYDAGAVLKMLASIGVVLLLFEVGLESSVREMMSVGVSSMLVAVLGVIAPMVLGFAVGWMLVEEAGWQVNAFIGATLCATSVGITARVLKDLGRSQQRESQIILGAAVIDDVLGLIVLAVVSGVINQGAQFDPFVLVVIIAKAMGFLFGAVALGNILFTRPLFRAASYLRGHGLLVITSLVICFGFSWLANVMGLATIVGAFAAGLILERAHYQELGHKENVELEEALQPLSTVLVPIFFVQMGIMVDLSSFRDPSLWGLAAALTAVAIIGKQVCAWGVLEKGLNRTAVGLGMIPRGEVGLIFAAEGAKLHVEGIPVVDKETYAAIVVMVMLTTMVTPPLLKWSLTRGETPPGIPDADVSESAAGMADTPIDTG